MDKNAILYMFKNKSTKPHVFMDSGGYICVYTIFSNRIINNTRCGCYYHNGLCLHEKELIHYDEFNIHYFNNQAIIHTISSSIKIIKEPILFYNISNRLARKTNSCHIGCPCCLNNASFLCDNCHITMNIYIWKHICARINVLSTYDGLINDIRYYVANILTALYVRI